MRRRLSRYIEEIFGDKNRTHRARQTGGCYVLIPKTMCAADALKKMPNKRGITDDHYCYRKFILEKQTIEVVTPKSREAIKHYEDVRAARLGKDSWIGNDIEKPLPVAVPLLLSGIINENSLHLPYLPNTASGCLMAAAVICGYSAVTHFIMPAMRLRTVCRQTPKDTTARMQKIIRKIRLL